MESPAAQAAAPTQESIDSKILTDLNVLSEKLDLCNSMLRPGGGDPAPSVHSDSTLLAVIGFLEACAPRMVELVEAGSQGALSENVLMQCLQVNDRLLKCLTDIDTVALTETPASTTAASVPENHDLLFGEDSSSSDPQTTTPAVGLKSTGEEEEEIDLFAAAPASETAVPPEATDDFDSFFEERTSGAGN